MTFSVLNTVRLPFIASLGLLGASAIAQSLLEVRPPGSQGMANEMRDTTAPASLRGAPELPPPDSAQIEAGSTRRIQVKGFDVVGNTQLSAKELLAASGVDAEQAPLDLSFADLQNMTRAMTATYRQQGFAVAVVQLLAQEIVDGRIVFSATEGALSKIDTKPDGLNIHVQERILAVGQVAVPPERHNALRQADVERVVLLSAETTNHQVDGTLLPGETVGTTQLQLDVKPKDKFSGSVQLDNAGSDSTGKQQVSTFVGVRNAAALGDNLTARLMASQDASSLNSYGLAYDLPLDNTGWRAGMQSLRVNYALAGAFSALGYKGKSTQNGVYASYALLRRFESLVDLRLEYSKANLIDSRGGSELNSSSRSAEVITTTLRGSFNDSMLTQPAFNQWGADLKMGYLQLGTASQQTSDQANLQTAGYYHVLLLDYLRDQSLASGWSALFNLRGQLANKNLDTFHKFSLGGAEAVRAFPGGEAAGDQGYLMRLELAHTMPFQFNGRPATSRLAAFYDHGSIHTNHTPLTANAASNKTTRAGRGVQWQWSQRVAADTDQINFRIFWAQATGAVARSVVDNKSWLIGAALGYKF